MSASYCQLSDADNAAWVSVTLITGNQCIAYCGFHAVQCAFIQRKMCRDKGYRCCIDTQKLVAEHKNEV